MASVWRSAADLVVEPDVAGFAYDDFKRSADLIEVGAKAMQQALPEVRKWLAPPAETAMPKVVSASAPAPAPMPAD
jgi:hypothetical protein